MHLSSSLVLYSSCDSERSVLFYFCLLLGTCHRNHTDTGRSIRSGLPIGSKRALYTVPWCTCSGAITWCTDSQWECIVMFTFPQLCCTYTIVRSYNMGCGETWWLRSLGYPTVTWIDSFVLFLDIYAIVKIALFDTNSATLDVHRSCVCVCGRIRYTGNMQCQCLSVVECVRAKYPYYHSKFLRTEQTATTSRGSLALKPEHYARLIDMLSELQGATSFSITCTCTDRL